MLEKRKKKSTHPPNSGVKENRLHLDFQKENVPPNNLVSTALCPGLVNQKGKYSPAFSCVPDAICPHLWVKQLLFLEIPLGRLDGER